MRQKKPIQNIYGFVGLSSIVQEFIPETAPKKGTGIKFLALAPPILVRCKNKNAYVVHQKKPIQTIYGFVGLSSIVQEFIPEIALK